MKTFSCLCIAFLLPLASSGASSSTNTVDVDFKEAPLREAAEFLTEKAGLKLLVAENYATIPITLKMSKATPEDVLAAIGASFAGSGSNIGWKESPLSDGQKAYVVAEMPPPPSKPLADCVKALKGAPRVTIQFKQAKLAEVVKYLEVLTGNSLTLVFGDGTADIPIDLKLNDVTPVDALLSINELLKSSGTTMAWRGVQLPSGRMIFALLDTQALAPPQPGISGPTRVYYVGDLGRTPDATLDSVNQLLSSANLRAEVNIHEETKMLVVKGNDEAHTFVKNVVDELRRGAQKAAAEPEKKQ